MKPNKEVESKITGSYLAERLYYDPNDGVFYIKKTRGGAIAGSETGQLRPDGYIQIKMDGRYFLAHRVAWVWMTGEWPKNDIDHQNRNRSDNRFLNLREATRKQNRANASIRSNNSSGVAGVFYLVRKDGRSPRWEASGRENGKKKRLGFFKNKEDAIAARRQWELSHHQDFAP
jgi:hypothetical protein